MKALLALAALGLLVYAVIECVRTPQEELPSQLPRSVWLLLMVVLPIVGPIWWVVATRGSAAPRGKGPRPGGGQRVTRRPVGPDDDPEFLRGL